MQETIPGEVMGKAQLLMKIKGDDALSHANMMAAQMRESSDEDYLFYWQQIVTQIELLIEARRG